jgi:hypothetical protein
MDMNGDKLLAKTVQNIAMCAATHMVLLTAGKTLDAGNPYGIADCREDTIRWQLIWYC